MAFRLCLFASFLAFSAGTFWWLKSPPPPSSSPAEVSTTDELTVTSAASSHNVPAKEKPKLSRVREKGGAASKESPQNLLDNWPLEGTGLAPSDIAPFLIHSQPENIVYFSEDGMKRISPKHYETGDAQSEQTLFLSDKKSIQKTAKEREENALASFPYSRTPSVQDNLRALPENAHEIVSFAPGIRANGESLVPIATDLLAALQGPDYSFDNFDASDDEKMRQHLSTVLPLGNSGMLVLRLGESGFILDTQGIDFSVFQTTFRIAGTDKFWQKFADIGVSEKLEPGSIKWFPCDPKNGVLKGCVGAVPTEEGGDRFDLAALGVGQAHYIWIKDTGSNFNFTSKWPTEGCAIDALRFYHAYTRK